MDGVNAGPIIEFETTLERFAGKGGWIYVLIPKQLVMRISTARGFVTVSGDIDGYSVHHVNIDPTKAGPYFWAVKKEIRDAIGKREGDAVQLRFWLETRPLPLPTDFTEALSTSVEAECYFRSLTLSRQRLYLNWVEEAKHPTTRDRRIVETVLRLERGLKFGEKQEQ